MSCMEEEVPLLGCMAVILFFSPFSGVPSFSLTLQVRLFFPILLAFDLPFYVKVTASVTPCC